MSFWKRKLDDDSDDLDDFKVVKKSMPSISSKLSFKKDQIESVGKGRGLSTPDLQNDTMSHCPTCSKLFKFIELVKHAQECQRVNMEFAAKLTQSKLDEQQSKRCFICNKSFAGYDEQRLNWHINMCLDQGPVTDKSEKKKLENKLPNELKKVPKKELKWNGKVIKVPKSKFDEKLIIAKTLSASEYQEKKDDIKRLKLLKKEPKIPLMLQVSPATKCKERLQAVEKCILAKAAVAAQKLIFSSTLPKFTEIKFSRKRLDFAITYDSGVVDSYSKLSEESFKSLLVVYPESNSDSFVLQN